MSEGKNQEIEILSQGELERISTTEKISRIIASVKDGNIIILESGLNPDEESRLVERTMMDIEPDGGFSGIEIESSRDPSDSHNSDTLIERLRKLANLEKDSNYLTIIGPENNMETLKGKDSISAIIKNTGDT